MPSPVKSVLFGVSQIRFTPMNPRRKGYEEFQGYDTGKQPSVAINNRNYVVQVHQGTTSSSLNLLIAKVEGTSLNFKSPRKPIPVGNGNHPSVALKENTAILMYESGKRLKYKVGTLFTNERRKLFRVDFGAEQEISNQVDSANPTVAVSRNGIVLEVHQQGPDVYWRRGKLEGTAITWSAATRLATGRAPSVAINNNGQAVAVFETPNGLVYAVGTFTASDTAITEAITWTVAAAAYQSAGVCPSVAMTDDSYVFVVHQSGTDLKQGVGILSGTAVNFQDVLGTGESFYKYDENSRDPCVATNGVVAVQVALLGSNELVGSACLFFDHANWMFNHRTRLSRKALRVTALPASHDSGAFDDNLARTQNLDIAGQLLYGIRYFDIRPRYIGDPNQIDAKEIVTYHDIPSGKYNGPRLPEVIKQVRAFMQDHKELVILKISHFLDFNQDIWNKLADAFLDETTGLKPWLFPRQAAPRLADRPITDYVKETQGTVLIWVDVDLSRLDRNKNPADYVTTAQNMAGLYRYRDWDAKHPEQGDVTVFDQFSSTKFFDTMSLSTSTADHLPGSNKVVAQGQLPKFGWFDGFCKSNADGTGRSTTRCELFLLSWTVTPSLPLTQRTPFKNAERANRNLASYLNIPLYQGASQTHRMHMNFLYTDAVEFSRSVDVAMVRNDLL